MKELKEARAGSLESGDVLVEIVPLPGDLQIVIDSTVLALYGKQIEKVVKSLLLKHQVEDVAVYVQDRGAFDFVIEARLVTALKRAGFNLL
ncbi:MAG: citrate lyase acyl carrier protein [Firmicutes bacterium]|jgi:citrate lyase subunit gamma (acyl carrier protein)|nr:citrate lyase acyl carrier protein [Bacillota bacterium]